MTFYLLTRFTVSLSRAARRARWDDRRLACAVGALMITMSGPAAAAEAVMTNGDTAPTAAQGPAVPDPTAPQVGAMTRTLLSIQRDGSRAGAALPVSGEQAALAYQRYLDSFRHPIPERFVGQSGAPQNASMGTGLAPAR